MSIKGNSMQFNGINHSINNVDRKVGLGWLNNKKIKNPLYEQMIYNTTEFMSVNGWAVGWRDQYCGDSIEDLMSSAVADGLDNILIIKIGIISTFLLEDFGDWLENNYAGQVLCGHILDKDNDYYELHPQCLMIDVNWWKSLGDAVVGEEITGEWTATEPLRSTENLHGGGYTPTWVSAGHTQRTYQGKKFGWRLIQQALDSETGALVWPPEVRSMYTYTYPEIDGTESLTNGLNILRGSDGFYVANTENFSLMSNYPTTPTEPTGEVNHVVSMAGGMSGLFESYKYQGYNRTACSDKQYLYIMDASRIALSLTRTIHKKWNGVDYKKFITEYTEEHNLQDLIKGNHRLNNLDRFINSNPEFTRWFVEEFQPYSHVQYHCIDLFDMNSFKRKMEKMFWNPIRHGQTTEIHRVHFDFSNCYQFLHTSWLYNDAQRNQLRLDMLKYLEQINMEVEVVDINVKNNISFVNTSSQLLDNLFSWRNK